MDKSLMLIVNPMAGRGSYRISFGDAMLILAQGGYRDAVLYLKARRSNKICCRACGRF